MVKTNMIKNKDLAKKGPFSNKERLKSSILKIGKYACTNWDLRRNLPKSISGHQKWI